MGALASTNGAKRFEDFVAFDVGPPRVADVPVNRAYSLESARVPGHFLRHRASELWADAKPEDSDELFALDASFVLVPGLLGYGYSLRSTNFPLDFMRHHDSRINVSSYDGSENLRGDATFELRQAEDSSSSDSLNPLVMDVCIMLSNSPGKYLCVDKDKRLVLERYQHGSQASYRFSLLPGFALQQHADLTEPLFLQDCILDPCHRSAEAETAGPSSFESSELKSEAASEQPPCLQPSESVVNTASAPTVSLPSKDDRLADELMRSADALLRRTGQPAAAAAAATATPLRAPPEFSGENRHWPVSPNSSTLGSPTRLQQKCLLRTMEFEPVD